MAFANYPRASDDLEALAVAADTYSLGDTLRRAPSHPCSGFAEDAARRALVGGELLVELVVFPDALRARRGPATRGAGVTWTTLDGGERRLELPAPLAARLQKQHGAPAAPPPRAPAPAPAAAAGAAAWSPGSHRSWCDWSSI